MMSSNLKPSFQFENFITLDPEHITVLVADEKFLLTLPQEQRDDLKFVNKVHTIANKAREHYGTEAFEDVRAEWRMARTELIDQSAEFDRNIGPLRETRETQLKKEHDQFNRGQTVLSFGEAGFVTAFACGIGLGAWLLAASAVCKGDVGLCGTSWLPILASGTAVVAGVSLIAIVAGQVIESPFSDDGKFSPSNSARYNYQEAELINRQKFLHDKLNFLDATMNEVLAQCAKASRGEVKGPGPAESAPKS